MAAKRDLPEDLARGQRIKDLLKDQGLTEQMVANAAGTKVRNVSNWKRGRPIRRANLIKLAEILKTTPEKLGGDLYIAAPATADERIAAAVWSGGESRRSGGSMRGGFERVAGLIAELRGKDPEVTLTSLHEAVEDLTRSIADLRDDLQERGVVGEAAEPPGKSDASEPGAPASETS
jgi:transcriptional regulator with XRE-family HTH domain